MVLDKKVAEQTINYLTQINAIKLNTKNPFTWTSGIKSPIYCDNRLLLSYPEIRKFIAEKMSEICLLYTSPSPRDATLSRMPSSA